MTGAGIGQWLLVAGSLGPLAATLVVLAPPGQAAARSAWWRRLSGIGGLASPAGAMCVLLPLLVAQLALDSWVMTGGIELPAQPRAVAQALPALLVGAVAGELAWRGHALPMMIRCREPVAPALLLGLLWALWQLPLFFVEGTWQAGMALPSIAAAMFFANAMAQSLILAALYLATRCTWAAVLFQALTGLAGELWQLPVGAELHRTLWTLLAAVLVLLLRPPLGVRPAQSAPDDRD